jgi:hypothetical protein
VANEGVVVGNNTQPQTIEVDGVQYEIESMTDEQKMLLNHVVDLERKLSSCLYQADQLRVGKDAFVGMLKASLTAKAAEPAAEAEAT